MKYRVVITEEALQRIDEQVRYIAQAAQAPLNAERWLNRVLAAAEELAHMPMRCPIAPESKFFEFDIRALNVDGFLLLFTISREDRAVIVLSARHGRQQPRPERVDSATRPPANARSSSKPSRRRRKPPA